MLLAQEGEQRLPPVRVELAHDVVEEQDEDDDPFGTSDSDAGSSNAAVDEKEEEDDPFGGDSTDDAGVPASDEEDDDPFGGDEEEDPFS